MSGIPGSESSGLAGAGRVDDEMGEAAVAVVRAGERLVDLSAIKDAGIVDIAWGPGFAMLAVISVFYYTSNYSLVKVLVCGMVVRWGVRLGLHIGLRKMNKSEDWRYAKVRK